MANDELVGRYTKQAEILRTLEAKVMVDMNSIVSICETLLANIDGIATLNDNDKRDAVMHVRDILFKANVLIGYTR